jgi:hypothetical protein
MAKVQAKRVKKPVNPADLTRPIPQFKDDNGQLVMTKLKGKDFPKTREGRIAYCEFQSMKWLHKGELEAGKGDPTQKKINKINKLKQMIELLQKEVESST